MGPNPLALLDASEVELGSVAAARLPCITDGPATWDLLLRGGAVAAAGTDGGRTSAPAVRRRCVSFSDPMMRRGLGLHHLIRGRGRLLRADADPDDAYGLSETVDRIDWFVSHSWATPPSTKFLTLALFFCWKPAAAAMQAFSLLQMALCFFEVMPVSLDAVGHTTYTNTLAGPLVFAAVLCFWPDLALRWHHEGPTSFYDKACIRQDSGFCKRQGISHLPAFLYDTSTLLVIYDDNYLRSMDSVVEIATFLAVNPEGKIVVLPTYLPKVAVVGTALISGGYMLLRVLQLDRFQALFRQEGKLVNWIAFVHLGAFGLAVPALVCLATVLRTVARERWVKCQTTVSSFRVAETSCKLESDREALQACIADVMTGMNYVGPDAQQLRALRAFDNLIRRQVPLVLEAAMGRVGIPYHYALMMTQGEWLSSLDRLNGMVAEARSALEFPAREFAAYLMYATTMYFAVGPLVLAAMAIVSSWWLGLDGVGLWCLNILASFACVAWFVGSNYVLDWVLRTKAVEEPWALFVFAVVELSLLALTYHVYRPRRVAPPKVSRVQQEPLSPTSPRRELWAAGARAAAGGSAGRRVSDDVP